MVAKSCCYLLYTSFQTSFSPFDFPLLKPLVQTGSSFASSLAYFPILGLLASHLSPYYFYPNECGGGKKAPKLFPAAIVRSRSPSSVYLSLPTSLLWSSSCISLQLCIYIFILSHICLQAPCPISSPYFPLYSGAFLLALSILLRALISVPPSGDPYNLRYGSSITLTVPVLWLPLCLSARAFTQLVRTACGGVRSGHDDCLAKWFCPCSWCSFYDWNS